MGIPSVYASSSTSRHTSASHPADPPSPAPINGSTIITHAREREERRRGDGKGKARDRVRREKEERRAREREERERHGLLPKRWLTAEQRPQLAAEQRPRLAAEHY